MRRPLMLAGVSAAAMAGLALSAGYPAAHEILWPPPTITVAPNAARLAATVTRKDLSELVKARLRRFNAAPLRGHRDAFGKDRLKAWTWTYLARSAVQLYRLNHDGRLIDLVLAGVSRYEADAQRHQASLGFGWYTEDARAPAPYREVPVTGLIMAPIVDLLQEASRDPELARLVAPHRERLLALLQNAISGLDARYIESGGKGYYLLPSGQDVEPLNLMSVYARPLLGLWQLTHDPEAQREITGIARTWKAALTIRPDGSVTWPHTPRPPSIAPRPDPAEVMIKSAAAIEFPLAAYEAGLVFERSDIEHLARAPETTLLEQVDDGHYRLREYVDTLSTAFVGLTDGGVGTVLRPASWYRYGCYDTGVTAGLDAYLFGVDAQFYRLSELALFGLTMRLALHDDPRLCSRRGQIAELGDPD
jgi:hypothetical protein